MNEAKRNECMLDPLVRQCSCRGDYPWHDNDCPARYPPVLDVCCGSRAFWFDKQDGRALFVDKRRETIVWGGKQRHGRCDTVIDPDQLADFTALPFPDDTFALVVWDPPHGFFGKTGIMAKTYGRLDDDWQGMLTKGFAECFRVLRPEGVLVFKWNEVQITVARVLALTPHKPLFGHKSGKQAKTHWIAFLKPNAALSGRRGATVRSEELL